MSFDNNFINCKRRDYLSWDEFFMGVVKLAAGRSKDPNTQVGACIVGDDNRILSIGYNGTPNGFDDDEFPWKREGSFSKCIFLPLSLWAFELCDCGRKLPCLLCHFVSPYKSHLDFWKLD